jgi:hypothetical protein
MKMKLVIVLVFAVLLITNCSEEEPTNPGNNNGLLNISEIGYFLYDSLTAYFEDVFIQNNYAYVSDNFTNVAMDFWGLRIIDVSDPKNPVEKGVFYKSFVEKCFVEGSFAYLATNGSGLIIVDVSNPSSPFQVGQDFSVTPIIRSVMVKNDYVYAACYDKDFCIFSTSTKSAPYVLSQLFLPGEKSDAVYTDGNFAYVIDQDSGLFVIDVSNASSPQLRGRFNEENYWDYSEFDDVVVSGNYAFVSSIQNLHIIDISDKTKPVQINRWELPAAGRDLFLQNNLLFVAANTDGIIVFNISDPANISLVGSFVTPDLAFASFAAGDKIFVADYNSGLRVLQYQ